MLLILDHLVTGELELFNDSLHDPHAARGTHWKNDFSVSDFNLNFLALTISGNVHPAAPLGTNLNYHPLYPDHFAQVGIRIVENGRNCSSLREGHPFSIDVGFGLSSHGTGDTEQGAKYDNSFQKNLLIIR